jgi:anti-sigma regulatory factor (Ser/Thr protein kinase)
MPRLELRPDPGSPRMARSFVRRLLREWSVDKPVIEDAALLVTEVVTNAVIHAKTPIAVAVDRDEDFLRFEVSDEDGGLVTQRHPNDRDATGRGMLLVDSLAADWDVVYRDSGKTVRFSLALDPSWEEQTV